MGLLVTKNMMEKAKEINQNGTTRFADIIEANKYLSNIPKDKKTIEKLIAERDEGLKNAAKIPTTYDKQKNLIVNNFNEKVLDVITPYLEVYYLNKKDFEFGKPFVVESKIDDGFFDYVDVFKENGLQNNISTLCHTVATGTMLFDAGDNETQYDIANYSDGKEWEVNKIDPEKYIDNSDKELDFINRTLESYQEDESPDIIRKNLMNQATLKQDCLLNSINEVDRTGKELNPASRRLAILNHIATKGLQLAIARRSIIANQLAKYTEKEQKVELSEKALKDFDEKKFNDAFTLAQGQTEQRKAFLSNQQSITGTNLAPYIDGQKAMADDNLAEYRTRCANKIENLRNYRLKLSDTKREISSGEHISQKEELENALRNYDLFIGDYFNNVIKERSELDGNLRGYTRKEIDTLFAQEKKKLDFEIGRTEINDNITLDGIKKKINKELKELKSVPTTDNLFKGMDDKEKVISEVQRLNYEAFEREVKAMGEQQKPQEKESTPILEEVKKEKPIEQKKTKPEIAEEKPYTMKITKEDFVSNYKEYKRDFANQKDTKSIFTYSESFIDKKSEEFYHFSPSPEGNDRNRYVHAVENRLKAQIGACMGMKYAHSQHGLAYKIFAFVPYLIEANKINKLTKSIEENLGKGKVDSIFNSLKEEGKFDDKILSELKSVPSEKREQITEKDRLDFTNQLAEETKTQEFSDKERQSSVQIEEKTKKLEEKKIN